MSIPLFDIFRVEGKGPMWVEPAWSLDGARARIAVIGKSEPGDYFVYGQRNRDRVTITVRLAPRRPTGFITGMLGRLAAIVGRSR
jgi:hypothetical protein